MMRQSLIRSHSDDILPDEESEKSIVGFAIFLGYDVQVHFVIFNFRVKTIPFLCW
jgi:hypothetical protein